MVFNTITPWRPRFSLNKSVGWEDPGKKTYKMFYDKTLVRLGLPSGFEKWEVFCFLKRWTKDGGKMFMKTRPAVQFLMLKQLTRATTLLWNGTGLGWKS